MEDLHWEHLHWLLFSSRQIITAETVAWDEPRDLARLLIDLIQPPGFPSVRVLPEAPKRNARLRWVGHPGSEYLEASIPGVQTNYDILVLSTG